MLAVRILMPQQAHIGNLAICRASGIDGRLGKRFGAGCKPGVSFGWPRKQDFIYVLPKSSRALSANQSDAQALFNFKNTHALRHSKTTAETIIVILNNGRNDLNFEMAQHELGSG